MSVHPEFTSIDAFLAWEARQERKHEFADGTVYVMPGSTAPHNQVVVNLVAAMHPHVRSRGCRIFASDMQLVTNAPSLRYPDLLVTCDERDAADRQRMRHPRLIIEVLSRGTANVDITDKLSEYQTIPELDEYVLIDSRKSVVRVFRRAGDAMVTEPPVVAGSILLRSIDLALELTAIYDGVDREGPPFSALTAEALAEIALTDA